MLVAARHRRRARLRGDALRCSATATRTGIFSNAIPTRRTSSADHLRTRDPAWASRITGCRRSRRSKPLPGSISERKRVYFQARLRLLALAQRRRQHARREVALRPWSEPGDTKAAGAFHNNGAIYHWNRTMIEGLDSGRSRSIRVLDQSRIGPILCGDHDALAGGVPVTALLIQNTNPVSVCPEQDTGQARICT